MDAKREVFLIFSGLIGREEAQEGFNYKDGEIPKAGIGNKNEKIISELTEDEQAALRLMDYVSDHNLVKNGELFRLYNIFWSTIRTRYGFTEGGDLGVRLGKYLVLCE